MLKKNRKLVFIPMIIILPLPHPYSPPSPSPWSPETEFNKFELCC